ncbi:MAG: holo-ACP synthase [Actinomycetota bacterium]|nr:holo-ACP synthase [Actinomycetota bacterium]
MTASATPRPPGAPDGRGVIGTGIDAVDIDRLRRVLERRPALVARLFTEDEQRYATRSRDPVPHLAARFAAKEATMKALGVGLGAFGLRDVAVVRRAGGPPELAVTGGAAALAAAAGVAAWLCTLTHTDHLALASVTALGGGPGLVV